jgi:hypothetical protein
MQALVNFLTSSLVLSKLPNSFLIAMVLRIFPKPDPKFFLILFLMLRIFPKPLPKNFLILSSKNKISLSLRRPA